MKAVVDIEDESTIPASQPYPAEPFMETAQDSLGREDFVDISDDDSQPITPTEIEGPKDSIEVIGEESSGPTQPADPKDPELVADDEIAYTASLDAIMTAGFTHDEAVHALSLKNNELGPAIEYLLEELNQREKYREELLNQVFQLDRVSESQVDYYQYSTPDLEAAVAGFKRNMDNLPTLSMEVEFAGENADPSFQELNTEEAVLEVPGSFKEFNTKEAVEEAPEQQPIGDGEQDPQETHEPFFKYIFWNFWSTHYCIWKPPLLHHTYTSIHFAQETAHPPVRVEPSHPNGHQHDVERVDVACMHTSNGKYHLFAHICV